MSIQRLIACAAVAAIVAGSSPAARTVTEVDGVTVQNVWENGRMQVHRVSLAPGAGLSRESTGGSVIVFLTGDLDGRMPAVEAAWRDPGTVTMENRGASRFEALVVDLKGSATGSTGVTAPEVVRASGTVTPSVFFETDAVAMMRAQNLILNDRISVTKERYVPTWSVDPPHFHTQDAVVIYLRSGYIWPSTPLTGPERVRRGDVRVVPGHSLHTAGNAGTDPLEYLLILPS